MLKVAIVDHFGARVGVLIRSYRQIQGISAKDLAVEVYDDPKKRFLISKLENGNSANPRAETLAPLFGHLGIPKEEVDACRAPKVVDEDQATHLRAVTAHAQQLEKDLVKAQADLKSAQAKDRKQLLDKITVLQQRAADPEAALAEANKTIAKLQETLNREGNALGEDLLARGQAALNAKDFTAADDIFAEIETREQLAVERAARAAFARGEIAEQEIRWADASAHFNRAARFDPCFRTFRHSWDLLWKTGKYDEALVRAKSMQKAAVAEFNSESFEFGVSLSCLGLTYRLLNDLENAAKCLEDTIPLQISLLGKNDPEIAKLNNNLANLYHDMGRLEQAEPLYKQAMNITKTTLGKDHPAYAIRLNNLANLYRDMGRLEQAEPLFKQAIEIDKATIGENHPEYATRLNNLALLYRDMGQLEQAEPLYKKAMNITKTTLGKDHPAYAIRLNNLANLYRDMGRLEQAEPLFKQAIAIAETTLGLDHPNTKKVKANYAKMQS